MAGSLPFIASAQKKTYPAGLELFSVRTEFAADPVKTLRDVAKVGYPGVEFFGPYYSWTPAQAKDMAAVLADTGMKCYSTHNGANVFATPDSLNKAAELNGILGSKYIVMASAGRVEGLDGWKKVAETLTKASEQLAPAKMGCGFHNHQIEFKPIDGVKPMEVIAKGTPSNVMLQLDVGTCIEAGTNPVDWIKANPGRIKAIHLKEWSSDPAKGYKVMFGEGNADWKAIFQAAETVGGLEYYLIEQEGGAVPPMEAIAICLANFKKIHG
jgi:sugar phosphate isomerase/epimerase